MRRFANGFIVLFLLDAGLSLIHDLLRVAAVQVPGLAMTRNSIAYLVIALSLVIFTLLGFDRRLPKRVFLPLTLYAFWCSLALWPLSSLIPRELWVLSMSVGQVLIGALVLATLHRSYGHTLLPAELFQRPIFGWRNTLVFSAVNLLSLPLVLAFSLLASADYYLDQATAGFMRVSPVGLYTSDCTYRRHTQEVRLVAMMHIARKEFYEELAASIQANETIILAEGVTDRDRLLQGRFHYGKLANVVGLSSQETMRLDGNLRELEGLEPEDEEERDETKPDIVVADIDVNRFSPQTVEFLNVLGRTLFGDQPFLQGLLAYADWAQEYGTPEVFSGLTTDILDKRNAVVIAALQQSLDRYTTIVVPWGGMHMPAIEAAVLQQGFVPGDKRERLLLSFRALWQD